MNVNQILAHFSENQVAGFMLVLARVSPDAEARALGLLEDELPDVDVISPEGGILHRLRSRTVIK